MNTLNKIKKIIIVSTILIILGIFIYLLAIKKDPPITSTTIDGATTIQSAPAQKQTTVNGNKQYVYYQESQQIDTNRVSPNAIVISWIVPNGLLANGYYLETQTMNNNNEWSAWEKTDTEQGNAKDTSSSDRQSVMLTVDSVDKFKYQFVYQQSSQNSIYIDPSTVKIELINTKNGPSAQKNSIKNKISSLISNKATADNNAPRIITRAEWGAPTYRWPELGWNIEYTKPERFIIHHTADSAGNDTYATMRAIWYYHAYRGTPDDPSDDWGDIGYNYVIDPAGNIFQGRDYDPNIINQGGNEAVGAHAFYYNKNSIGISVMGNYSDINPADAAFDSVAKLMGYKSNIHKLNPAENASFGLRTIGHRDVNATACPGDVFYARLPELRGLALRYATNVFNSPYYGASNPPTLYYDQALTQEVYKMNGIYHLNPAQQAYLKVNSTNYGTGIWPKANTKLGTINPRDRTSKIASNSWLSNVRMSGFTEPNDVANGNNANFVASITAPNTPGLYSEDLAVVVEGVSWVNGTNVSVPIAISANVNQPPRKDYLGPNEYLTPGQNVLSQDTHTVLHLSFNGKLELWVNYKKVWSSINKDGIGGNRLINQPDGNIVLYKDNTPVWDSLTIGRAGNLVVQGDGNLVLNPLAAPPESISNTSTVNQGPILNSVLKSNDVLFPGQILYSQNGYYRLALQEDGNVVLYTPTRPIWASNTYMRKFDQLIVQNDGNIVSYDGYGFPVWSTGTFMSGGNTLIVQEDGNIVLYNPTRPVWSTNTFTMR